jgi:uncharacterized membrane protein YdfJ with MMPL/SSD domain
MPETAVRRAGALARYADFVIAHARAVLVAWAVVAIVAGGVAAGLFGHLANSGIYVPHGAAERTMRALARNLPGEGASRVYVVAQLRRPAGIDEAAPLAAERVLAGQPGVARIHRIGAGVRYEPHGGIALLAGVAGVELSLDPPQAEQRVPALEAALRRASRGSLTYALLGDPVVSARYAAIARHDLVRAERITFPVTLALLVVAFLSVTAAAIPLLLAGVGLTVTFAILYLGWRHSGLSVFVTDTASVLALGLSIDYSLFMIARFREERDAGASTDDALRRTLLTTGRAVLLSGVTIALSVLSLLAVGVGVFTSMAIGATLATLVSVLTALTLFPAIVCVLGPRVESLGLRRAARAASRAGLWRRLAAIVTGHPAAAAAASLLVMLALAAPLPSIRAGFHTVSALPAHEAVRRASAQLDSVFGPGTAGPVEVATRGDGDRLEQAIGRDPGVKTVWGLARGRDGWWGMHATLRSSPDGDEARATVERLRAAYASGSQPTLIGGPTQARAELTDRIDARTPVVVALACALALVALVTGLRSIVVPVKALLTSLLSIAATLGVVWRLFPSSPGPPTLEFFVPLFLFAIIFGLSVDYEVFLLSRIREAVLAGEPNRAAVRTGLVRSARSITLAGATLVTVFVAFTGSQLDGLRQLGGGVAIAIVLDVTVVRCVLVPATVTLLGRWNWWLPGRSRAAGRRA